MSGVPLLVRAHLASGIAHAGPWGIALDGLLAAELWADRKAAVRDAGELAPALHDVDEPEDLPLPLERCITSTGLWHWAATCAYPEHRASDAPEVRYWTGRADHTALEALADGFPASLSDRQGRYRARYMPLLVTVCRSVVWRCVGDPERITELLKPVAAIGKKRSAGEGQVLAWEITPTPDEPWSAAHLHPHGALGRPVPEECLRGRSVVDDGGVGTAGIRPPYMHQARQHQLRLPALLDG